MIAYLDSSVLARAYLAGPVLVLGAPQEQIEHDALALVRDHALRAMDAWHLAAAAIIVPKLAEPDEPQAFATRDATQRAAAEQLGFVGL